MTIGSWLSFRGRIGRKVFWLGYVLPLMAVSIIASVLDVSFGFMPMGDAVPADATPMGPVSGLVSLLSIWPSLAGAIKRLHDRDRSGWWIGGFYLLGAMGSVVSTALGLALAQPDRRVLALLQADGRLFGLTYPGHWCDIGHPGGIALAETLLERGDV